MESYVTVHVWLFSLSSTFLRFIPIVPCNCASFLSVAKEHSIMWKGWVYFDWEMIARPNKNWNHKILKVKYVCNFILVNLQSSILTHEFCSE